MTLVTITDLLTVKISEFRIRMRLLSFRTRKLSSSEEEAFLEEADEYVNRRECRAH